MVWVSKVKVTWCALTRPTISHWHDVSWNSSQPPELLIPLLSHNPQGHDALLCLDTITIALSSRSFWKSQLSIVACHWHKLQEEHLNDWLSLVWIWTMLEATVARQTEKSTLSGLCSMWKWVTFFPYVLKFICHASASIWSIVVRHWIHDPIFIWPQLPVCWIITLISSRQVFFIDTYDRALFRSVGRCHCPWDLLYMQQISLSINDILGHVLFWMCWINGSVLSQQGSIPWWDLNAYNPPVPIITECF